MYRRKALASAVHDFRVRKGFSALAASRASRVSMNVIRNIERGISRPTADTLDAFSKGLALSGSERALLRRLAGIDPDPGATPEARRARREAWRPLTWLLVNHVLLPRLELGEILGQGSAIPPAERAVIEGAAAEPDATAFADAAAGVKGPPPAIGRLIESNFHDLAPDAVGAIQHIIAHDQEIRDRCPGRPSLLGPWNIAVTLEGFWRPQVDAFTLRAYLFELSFDRNFAIAVFPIVYWNACLFWPFEKVLIAGSLLPESAQRQLHRAIRDGLPLEDLDRALMADNKLGEDLLLAVARSILLDRGDDEGDAAAVDKAAAERRAERPYTVRLWGQGTSFALYRGPRPPNDLIFDHLDRCEFLERFPILKIDREFAEGLGRSSSLPSWAAWCDQVATYGASVPPEIPPRSPERFASSLRTPDLLTERPAHDLPSLSHRLIAMNAEHLLGKWLVNGDWRRIEGVTELLGFDPKWRRIIDGARRSQPAKPPTRTDADSSHETGRNTDDLPASPM